MKLLTRTNIYFLLLTLIVFSLGGSVFYERVHSIVKSDATEKLNDEREKIMNYVSVNHALPQNALSLGDSVSFSAAAGNEECKIGHLKLYNKAEQEYEPYQTLTFFVITGSQAYKAIIYRPLIESDDLTTAVAETIAIIACCLLLVLLVSNFFISKIVWKPFYRTLEKIKSFDLIKESKIEFDKTNIQEFKELNEVIGSMTKKIATDYHSLKEFTENASHELQTPLAIIQSKLELLIQSENLSAKQMEEVQAVYEAAGRLSRLNQALLLLAKIENKQFGEAIPIALNDIIKNKLEAFSALIDHKNIIIEKHLMPLSVKMNPALADMLINNLIGNAIKHNVQGGKLSIMLSEKSFTIENTGKPLTTGAENLFFRFRKNDESSDSLGLGLAIVKQICDEYGFQIEYKYAGGLHTIHIRF